MTNYGDYVTKKTATSYDPFAIPTGKAVRRLQVIYTAEELALGGMVDGQHVNSILLLTASVSLQSNPSQNCALMLGTYPECPDNKQQKRCSVSCTQTMRLNQ